ncbi:hypothetical protein PJI17_23845 [Mycobacterium kansasii]
MITILRHASTGDPPGGGGHAAGTTVASGFDSWTRLAGTPLPAVGPTA